MTLKLYTGRMFDIWILIRTSLHENVGTVGADMDYQRVHAPSI